MLYSKLGNLPVIAEYCQNKIAEGALYWLKRIWWSIYRNHQYMGVLAKHGRRYPHASLNHDERVWSTLCGDNTIRTTNAESECLTISTDTSIQNKSEKSLFFIHVQLKELDQVINNGFNKERKITWTSLA